MYVLTCLYTHLTSLFSTQLHIFDSHNRKANLHSPQTCPHSSSSLIHIARRFPVHHRPPPPTHTHIVLDTHTLSSPLTILFHTFTPTFPRTLRKHASPCIPASHLSYIPISRHTYTQPATIYMFTLLHTLITKTNNGFIF